MDPAPLRRIGWEWMRRARGMRTLLEALFVRSDPGKFCCGSGGVHHALAILWGEIVERDQLWRAEVRAQDPGIVFMGLLDVPVHIWWVSQCAGGAGRIVRRDIEKELPAWCSVVNPGVEEAYFQLWRDLNMLYERLSLPWKLLQCPEVRRPIRAVVDSLYYDIDSLWRIRRGNVQNCNGLPMKSRSRHTWGGDSSRILVGAPWRCVLTTIRGTPGWRGWRTISSISSSIRGRNVLGNYIESTAPGGNCRS